ncbi:lactocepin [Bacillus sp. HMF5848]|uniref:S8 family serine peptidase n=1 Tax=Bacillus sp. HMF5848 TaxID=2495421 RepID=UPI000F781E61|nr:S8 family serine peptidase [Bacillus sp. HMF5848]RSK28653.1 lactocepin [Bacillus sp. HMF5848]
MKLKQLFTLLTAILLIFSNAAGYVASAASQSTEKVRVIVELDQEPGIAYAKKANKKFGDLSDAEKATLQNKALRQQSYVKQDMNNSKIDITYKESFTTIFNGFSGEVSAQDVAKIKQLPNVKNVYVAHEYKRPAVVADPQMSSSTNMVTAQKVWGELGYKGEGMVVAVLDTGIDPWHKDMVLSDETVPALSEEAVNTFIAEKGLPGKYFTEKVPYGFNYADENDEILDLGPAASMHGMHVSGTVGANGNFDDGGVKGVAPEAQLLAMKVFGNDPEMPSTYSDIYVKAIDDAIALGADVINMSLGASAAFVKPDDPEQQSIRRAVESGVLVAISAGNSGQIAYGSDMNPFAANPDIGVVGSPSLSDESLSVANLQNEYIELDAFDFGEGENAGKATFLSASSVHPNDLETKTYEIVYAGLGRLPGDSEADPNADDFKGLDLEGKFALIQRGETLFVSKALNAQAAGAAGVIIFNHSPGYVTMASDPAVTIPQLFILQEHGDAINALLDGGDNVSITFSGEKMNALNPEAGKLNDSTSWGVTPSLDFKPEITAPGTSIKSTVNNDKYELMTGTSMAAPHVAGGAALVLQKMKEDIAAVTGAERVQMAKNILMNTATPIADLGTYNAGYGVGNPYSPRRQGAGLMDLYAALQTPVVVTDVTSGVGKVALKEIGDSATFTLQAENFGSSDVSYVVSGNVLTDMVMGGTNMLEAQGIFKNGTIGADAPWVGEFPISFKSAAISEVEGEQVLTVPAGGKVTFEVTVDLADTIDWVYNSPLDEVFDNGYFVEGFVSLKDRSDMLPELTVPYVGFHGEWSDAPVLDSFGSSSFFGESGLVSDAVEYAEGVEAGDADAEPMYDYLGTDPLTGEVSLSRVAISPNGDGVRDAVVPLVSFLRNAKEVVVTVMDGDGNKRTLMTGQEFSKHYFNGVGDTLSTFLEQAKWDGTINNMPVVDGKYYLEFKARVDESDARWQTTLISVLVDTMGPSVDANYDALTKELTIAGNDAGGSGVAYYDVLVNRVSVLTEGPLAADTTSYTLDSVKEGDVVTVVAYDYAGNAGKAVATGDDVIPFVTAVTPAALDSVNSRVVTVEGYVVDDSDVAELTVAGKAVELVWDPVENHYDFVAEVVFEQDGVQSFMISASDIAGNDISFKRSVIVDSSAPAVTVDAPLFVDGDVGTAVVKYNVSDNFNELRVYENGSEVYRDMMDYPLVMKAGSYAGTANVKLHDGENTFVIEAYDVAGNVVTREVNIYRGYAEVAAFVDAGWAAEEVGFLQRLGILSGVSEDRFGAGDAVTRADAVQWLAASLELDVTSDVADPGFSDVDVAHPAYAAIAAAKAAGIVSGNGGKFNPDAALTRAQMAKILAVAFDLDVVAVDVELFSDVMESHWARGYVDALFVAGITTGKADGSFAPEAFTTRAELAVFLARALDDRFKD